MLQNLKSLDPLQAKTAELPERFYRKLSSLSITLIKNDLFLLVSETSLWIFDFNANVRFQASISTVSQICTIFRNVIGVSPLKLFNTKKKGWNGKFDCPIVTTGNAADGLHFYAVKDKKNIRDTTTQNLKTMKTKFCQKGVDVNARLVIPTSQNYKKKICTEPYLDLPLFERIQAMIMTNDGKYAVVSTISSTIVYNILRDSENIIFTTDASRFAEWVNNSTVALLQKSDTKIDIWNIKDASKATLLVICANWVTYLTRSNVSKKQTNSKVSPL